ncbi:MAG TPA: restriction endonuclease [bacterium]|nr:restriction endonuclease [bacterium]
MESLIFIIIIISVIILYNVFFTLKQIFNNSQEYIKLLPNVEKLKNLEKLIDLHERKVLSDYKILQEQDAFRLQNWIEKVDKDKNALEILAKQKSMGFPWLAEAYADYFYLYDIEREKSLKTRAFKAIEIVKQIKEEKKQLIKENKFVHYKNRYYENLFPWIVDLVAETEDEYIPNFISTTTDEEKNDDDRVMDFLTIEEYKKLPTAERNQLALDRYLKSRNKSKWSIGRDYEMYIGWLYESDGWVVEYKGILDGLEDLGRDIIAKKKNAICVIQCKHWAQYKTIHEKHIFQLFGTTMEYWLKNFGNKYDNHNQKFFEFSQALLNKTLRPIFISSTNLSDKAKEVAEALNVEIVENKIIDEFPRIKCNINYDEFGFPAKIYHLPMDQQYDRTIITKNKGEFYAFTVREAEAGGFRRAFKHRF